jgi:nucleotide-binding universal stress UspA family protein
MNTVVNPIVVGVDDSPPSYAALDWATAEAARRRVPLRLVHVVESPSHGLVPPIRPVAEPAAPDLPSRAAEAVRTLEQACETIPDVTIASLDGDPASVLIQESAHASLVVVGNRGLGGFRGLLAGSVSVQTAAHARCPVVVVRPSLSESASSGPERHGSGRIVVGTDCSDRSDRAVAFAFAEADLRGIGLTVVHAWRYPVSTSPGEMIFAVVNRTDLADVENDLVAKSFAEHREAHPGVPVRQVLAQGNAAGVLVHESFGAELLVVGSRGHGGFAGLLLGSVSDAAIRHAGCPVAVVR